MNFCSPTVLDRLNALLEPHGVLQVNERGVVNGEIKTIVPHPNFRLFFILDPKYGEISRAMRNRGIEIFMHDLPIPSRDVNVLLNAVHIPGMSLFPVDRH